MHFLTNRYTRIPVTFLLIAGLWPYQTSKYLLAHRIFFTVYFVLLILCQLAAFVTHSFTLTMIMNSMCMCFCCSITLIRYTLVWSNIEKLKVIFDNIGYVWAHSSNEERAILEKYGERGLRHTLYFIGVLVAPLSIGAETYFPVFLDLLVPLNESRPRELPTNFELFFVDQKESYQTVIAFCGLVMVAVTLFSTETLFTVVVHQCCAFYKLAAYRVNYAMKRNVHGKLRPTAEVHRILISGLKMHCFATRFTRFVECCFNTSYTVVLVMGFTSLMISIFAALANEDFRKLYGFSILIIIHFYYNFYIHISTQTLMDHVAGFFKDIYSTLWYDGTLFAKKLILFLMRGNWKDRIFQLGGIYVPNYEGLSLMTNTAISYFMVAYSIL